jgi:hypothetical protein
VGQHQESVLNLSIKRFVHDFPFDPGGSVFLIGKTLELIGMALLGAGLYIGCINPHGLSEGKAMGAEMGSLAIGILIFFLGRMLEKHRL